jgi:hypothetical protein
VIPYQYFIEFSFQSLKRSSPIKIDGDLSDWDEINLVPDLMHLRSERPFADVYFSWDDDNLYIGFKVLYKINPVEVDTRGFWRRDCMELWIDLRNDKTHRRYTEHCHQFFLLPKGRKGKPDLATAGECRQPGSAIQENIYDHPEIEIASVIDQHEYSVEARIPESVIPTYDPVNQPFIGFNYHINNTDRRAQWWSCGQDFSRHTDSSTWGSIELVE